MQFKPCFCCCIYIGSHYYNIANTVGYSYNTNTDTECTRHAREIASYSSLIHAVVLCESAQRYRALLVILQSHRTQNMILRCYPNVSAILRRHTKSCLLCFFNNPYISPFFNSQNFLFTCLCSFFYMLCSIIILHQAGALLRPKNGYLVWSRGASSARARRAQAQNIAAA